MMLKLEFMGKNGKYQSMITLIFENNVAQNHHKIVILYDQTIEFCNNSEKLTEK